MKKKYVCSCLFFLLLMMHAHVQQDMCVEVEVRCVYFFFISFDPSILKRKLFFGITVGWNCYWYILAPYVVIPSMNYCTVITTTVLYRPSIILALKFTNWGTIFQVAQIILVWIDVRTVKCAATNLCSATSIRNCLTA